MVSRGATSSCCARVAGLARAEGMAGPRRRARALRDRRSRRATRRAGCASGSTAWPGRGESRPAPSVLEVAACGSGCAGLAAHDEVAALRERLNGLAARDEVAELRERLDGLVGRDELAGLAGHDEVGASCVNGSMVLRRATSSRPWTSGSMALPGQG